MLIISIRHFPRGARWVLGAYLFFVFPTTSMTQSADATTYHGIAIASDRELNDLRGGFVLANGMTINISIDKTIFTNGVQTYASYFEVPENLFSAQSGQLLSGASLAANSLGSVTQNTLNNQLIEIMRIVNIEILNLPGTNLDLSDQRVVNQLLDSGL